MAAVEIRPVGDVPKGASGAEEPLSSELEHEETVDRAALLVRLDELLELYLNTLDKYQKAQQQLSSTLSSGYMSLARANFNNQSRTRYGQDHYDDRMQASSKVTIQEDDTKTTFSTWSIPYETPKTKDASTPASEDGSGDEDSRSESKEEKEDKSDADDEVKAPVNPLKWFGILVPPELRSAQSSFVSAVDEPIPLLATLVRELRRQEGDIGRLRKRIRRL